jgi:hypothetical protein
MATRSTSKGGVVKEVVGKARGGGYVKVGLVGNLTWVRTVVVRATSTGLLYLNPYSPI